MIFFNYVFLKVSQGLGSLIILVYGRWVLEPEEFVILLACIPINALINAIDGGLAVNILHKAAYHRENNNISAEKELYCITKVLYELLSYVFGLSICIGGLFYLNLTFNMSMINNILWMINSILIVLYFRNLGTFSFLEGVDKSKQIIATRLKGSVGALVAIFILINTDYALASVSMMFLCVLTVYAYHKNKYRDFISHITVGKKELLQIFYNKYWNNQKKFFISSAGGYLAFSCVPLIILAKHQNDLVRDFVFILNLQLLLLGFSSVIIQPKLNKITEILKNNNLNEFKKVIFSSILMLFLITAFLVIVGFTLEKFSFINLEFSYLCYLSLLNWLFLSLIYIIYFVYRCKEGESLYAYSFIYGIILCLVVFFISSTSIFIIQLSYLFTTFCYLIICIFLYEGKHRTWWTTRIT